MRNELTDARAADLIALDEALTNNAHTSTPQMATTVSKPTSEFQWSRYFQSTIARFSGNVPDELRNSS